MRWLRWGVPLVIVLPIGAWAWAYWQTRPDPVPRGLSGRLIFVSDRDGIDALYLRDLASGEEHRLTHLNEPIAEPALSPSGRHVAFTMRGRVGMVSVATGAVRILSLGLDWKDATPSWRGDEGALLVSARRGGALNADVHLLRLDPAGGDPVRTPLTDTPGLDETQPVFTPRNDAVVVVREDNLFRIELGDARSRRLTGGFKRMYNPRFLPSGRLLFLWTESKQYGIDVMDEDGKERETLWQGSVYYRTLSASHDGRFLVATFTFDLAFHPSQALKLRQTEEVRLLDARGNHLCVLERSWRHSNHSPNWGG
jgi:Tol biopolymer transport system component